MRDIIPWRERATCARFDPEVWFTERDVAISLCLNVCPVLEQCRAYADRIGAVYGVWAGEWRDKTPMTVRSETRYGTQEYRDRRRQVSA